MGREDKDPRSEAEKARADLMRNDAMGMAVPESPLERQPSVTPQTFGDTTEAARVRSGTDQGVEAGGVRPPSGGDERSIVRPSSAQFREAKPRLPRPVREGDRTRTSCREQGVRPAARGRFAAVSLTSETALPGADRPAASCGSEPPFARRRLASISACKPVPGRRPGHVPCGQAAPAAPA